VSDTDCTDCIPHGVESEFPAGMNPSSERWCACKRGSDAKAAHRLAEALELIGLAATAFRTGFFPPFGLPETNQPPRIGVTRWPFVESPGEFAERLEKALFTFDGYVLGAVRNTLIENPPIISDEYLQSIARHNSLPHHQPYDASPKESVK
jgi:hypothetical protein